MPELPEVENVKLSLENSRLVNKKIKNVEVITPKLIKDPNDEATFVDRLTESVIHDFGRRGKFLFINLVNEEKGGMTFVVHLGMTGALFAVKEENKIPAKYRNHQHVKLTLDNGSFLIYCDIRKFGALRVVTPEEAAELPVAKYGPDAVSYDINNKVVKKLRSIKVDADGEPKLDANGDTISIYGNKAIKEVLMDQEVIAGIGNIYASEACHMCQIHPATKVKDLTDEQIISLVGANRATMELSISMGGTSFSDYVNSQGQAGEFADCLQVYGREGLDCNMCGTGYPIQKMDIAKRSTFFCPNCQPVI